MENSINKRTSPNFSRKTKSKGCLDKKGVRNSKTIRPVQFAQVFHNKGVFNKKRGANN